MLKYLRRLFKKDPRRSAAARQHLAMARVSFFDDVVSTRHNPDGTFTIFVRGSVAESYERIVKYLRKEAPGLHGDVRKAPENMHQDAMRGAGTQGPERSPGRPGRSPQVWLH